MHVIKLNGYNATTEKGEKLALRRKAGRMLNYDCIEICD